MDVDDRAFIFNGDLHGDILEEELGRVVHFLRLQAVEQRLLDATGELEASVADFGGILGEKHLVSKRFEVNLALRRRIDGSLNREAIRLRLAAPEDGGCCQQHENLFHNELFENLQAKIQTIPLKFLLHRHHSSFKTYRPLPVVAFPYSIARFGQRWMQARHCTHLEAVHTGLLFIKCIAREGQTEAQRLHPTQAAVAWNFTRCDHQRAKSG